MRQPGDIVENQFPTLDPGDLRIAAVGQSPGEDEDHQGTPFVGRAGRLLDDALERVGLVRGRMFVGNVCQRRPNKENDFDRLEWDGAWVQEGIAQLRADLEKFRPNIVLCLGNEALHLFRSGNKPPRKKWEKGQRIFDWKDKIGNWRGSLFASSWLGPNKASPDYGVKCLAAYHPSFVVRDNYAPQVYYRVEQGVGDFERLKVEAGSPGLELPRREVRIWDNQRGGIMDVRYVLDWLAKSPKPVAVDIEGGPGNITSIAFATRRDVAHVVPLAGIDGRSIWTEEQEVAIWEAVKVVLEDARIPKLVMNASYDFFAIPWTYGITPQGELLDIMESAWEWQPELRLGLATQVSLLTRWPFYKPDKEEGGVLKFASDQEFWTYNGHDAANTVECYEETIRRLDKGQRAHFRFNVELGAGKLYMMLRGVLVDQERVKEERGKAQRAAFELQAKIDQALSLESEAQEFYTGMQLAMNEQWFARLVLARLGGKNPAVPTEVVVERWQPFRHNGKRWVKAGKLVTQLPEPPFWDEPDEPNPEWGSPWLKPAHKTILRRLPFTPTTLADCEPHILESKRAEWKRVKAIWKELRHDDKKHDDNDPNLDTRELRGRSLLGELSLLLGLGVNTGSNSEGGDSQWFLYEVCGLPRIFKNERTGKYSRESEKEWKARTSKGVTNERRQRRTKKSDQRLAAGAVDAGGAGSDTSLQAGMESDGGRADPRAVPGTGTGSPSEGHRGTPGGDQPAPGRGGEGGAGAGGADDQAGENEGRLDEPQVELSHGGLSTQEGLATPTKASGKKVSTDQQALDLLYAYTRDERCLWVLQQRRLRKVVSDLKGDLVDHDGRARSSVSFVKETGRMSYSDAPHGTGLGNAQALNKDLRRIVIAG